MAGVKRSIEPSIADLLAWMKAIPTPSWSATVRDVDYAVAEIKDEARRKRRRERRT